MFIGVCFLICETRQARDDSSSLWAIFFHFCCRFSLSFSFLVFSQSGFEGLLLTLEENRWEWIGEVITITRFLGNSEERSMWSTAAMWMMPWSCAIWRPMVTSLALGRRGSSTVHAANAGLTLGGSSQNGINNPKPVLATRSRNSTAFAYLAEGKIFCFRNVYWILPLSGKSCRKKYRKEITWSHNNHLKIQKMINKYHMVNIGFLFNCRKCILSRHPFSLDLSPSFSSFLLLGPYCPRLIRPQSLVVKTEECPRSGEIKQHLQSQAVQSSRTFLEKSLN